MNNNVMAQGCPWIKEALGNGHDVHTFVASKMFEVPMNEVSKQQRELAKRRNYSVMYTCPIPLAQGLRHANHT